MWRRRPQRAAAGAPAVSAWRLPGEHHRTAGRGSGLDGSHGLRLAGLALPATPQRQPAGSHRSKGGTYSGSHLPGVRPRRDNVRWKTRRDRKSTSELQSRPHLVCRLLLEKKKKKKKHHSITNKKQITT